MEGIKWCRAAARVKGGTYAAPVSGGVVQGSPPEVRTSANVTRSVPADLAVVTIQLIGRGPTTLEATRTLARRVAVVRTALVKVGIPGDSLFSRGSPAWYYWGDRMNLEVKYNRATQHYDSTFTMQD